MPSIPVTVSSQRTPVSPKSARTRTLRLSARPPMPCELWAIRLQHAKLWLSWACLCCLVRLSCARWTRPSATHLIGFPLMLKAAAGGGGRGIRLVEREQDFERSFTLAQNEAREAFRDDGIYLERYLAKARHIEIQVPVDNFGHGVHLGERNCSCQRRNQKVLEESPSPLLPPELRAEIGQKAINAVVQVGYRNAGTLEFLVDEANRYYFMEMNTRLQVEHPVTELVTSTDLVKEQIRIASGLPLRLQQDKIEFRGHAIECRITAEDADNDFRPQTGIVEKYLPPSGPGVRVDSHLYAGYEVPPHYDSLLAKLI